MEDIKFSKKQQRTAVHSTFSRVVKNSQLQAKIAAYLVSMGRLLCLAFLYGWHFLYKISLVKKHLLKTMCHLQL